MGNEFGKLSSWGSLEEMCRSVNKLFIVVVTLTCLPTGTAAQGLGVAVDVGVQGSFDRYRELGGLSVGVQVGYSTGDSIHHYLGLRGTVNGARELYCINGPGGTCLNSVKEPAMVTLSYEARFFMAPRSARFRPFIGGTIGIARGWDGLGTAAGLSYGLNVRAPARAVVTIGGATQRYQMSPAGPEGNGSDYFGTRVQVGLGWSF